MAPLWLDLLAWISLTAAFICAATIVVDIFGRGNRQKMWIMEAVWPITALYAGPLALLAFRRYGRGEAEYGSRVSTAIAVSHCGAGCTLGDIVGEWVVFATGVTIAGAALWPEFVLDYTLAFGLGIAFQYFSIAPMRDLGVREGIAAALKADTFSLMAFEVGLFGWMALMFYVLFPAPERLHPDSPGYWLLMQIGMLIGFLTAYPVNAWLIRRGIKEEM